MSLIHLNSVLSKLKSFCKFLIDCKLEVLGITI